MRLLWLHLLLPAHFLAAAYSKGAGIIRREVAPELGIRKSLEDNLDGISAKRLFAVETIVKPTFEAFPKNRQNKVPMQAIHSLVRGYFAEQHGWLFRSFEFTSANATELQASQILKDKAPALVSALREAERLDLGLSLSEVVATVSALEDMVLEESVALLPSIYKLLGFAESDSLDKQQLDEVLTSYLLVFREGSRRNLTDVRRHGLTRTMAQQQKADWDRFLSFGRESVKRAGYKSPYSMDAASKVVKDMALMYGKWQNTECTEMKETLLSLEDDGTGRVSLERFYDQPKHAHYTFTEPVEYLRQAGVLEELEGGVQKVLVANYLAGSSNCIASSQYVSVCCLSECEQLFSELQARVQGSEVPLQNLLDAVAGIASSTVDAPRQLREELVEKAREMTKHHMGLVPLHSADFKRWFHSAFPNECPVPTAIEAAAEDAEHAAMDRWLGIGRVLEWQRGDEL
eukprot:TRINITY_DN121734_c0_g1_i1.p1 TRINITY_DN121734_c0_g1~~TRINITY_DN121734_c0_g1_i1.p1  ORF type:complete len:460 (+),score=143.16 TRINITY_DN121734_c0_g1_i1:77-1456(+)